MIDLIIKNYQAIIGLIGSFTGLLGLAITFYSKYRDSNIKEKELELKKEQFELDKKHQIAKEVYQELFSNKIQVYKNLYDELMKYKKKLTEIGKEDYDIDSNGEMIYSEVTTEDINITTLINIFTIVEKNIFVVSLEIEKLISTLMISYQSKENEFDWLFSNEISTEDEAIRINHKLDKEFFINHQNKIDELFNQIECEIKKMKQEIGFI